MQRNFVTGLMVLCVILILLIFPASVISQTNNVVLRAYQVNDELTNQGITSQKAISSIKNIETLLKNPKINDPAQLLYNMAKYKIFLGYSFNDNDYVKKHPNDYLYHELGNFYIYKGNDLKTIIQDYPNSKIADDAGYMLATTPMLGECEGYIPCHISRETMGFKPFFEKFPQSVLIKSAISDINQSVNMIYDKNLFNIEDKKDILDSIAVYLKMLQTLDSRFKVYGLYNLAKAYRKLGKPDKAKLLYNQIINNYPDFQDIKKVKTELNTLTKKK